MLGCVPLCKHAIVNTAWSTGDCALMRWVTLHTLHTQVIAAVRDPKNDLGRTVPLAEGVQRSRQALNAGGAAPSLSTVQRIRCLAHRDVVHSDACLACHVFRWMSCTKSCLQCHVLGKMSCTSALKCHVWRDRNVTYTGG